MTLDTKAMRVLADERDDEGLLSPWETEACDKLRQCADEIDRQVDIINGLSMVIDQNLLDLEAKDREIERLRAENERLRIFDGQELIALRAELHALDDALRAYRKESDTMRGANERLRDELVALQERNDTLRELVREAMPYIRTL